MERLYLLRLAVFREHHVLRRDHSVHVPETAIHQLRSHSAGFHGFGRRFLPAENKSEGQTVSVSGEKVVCSPSFAAGVLANSRRRELCCRERCFRVLMEYSRYSLSCCYQLKENRLTTRLIFPQSVAHSATFLCYLAIATGVRQFVQNHDAYAYTVLVESVHSVSVN